MDASRNLNCKVVGVTFEDRQTIIALMTTDSPCRLVPEPENLYDPNAIRVEVAIGGGIHHIGYIPREIAAQVAPVLDNESLMCKVSEITGGFELEDGGIANYGVRLNIELPPIPIGL